MMHKYRQYQAMLILVPRAYSLPWTRSAGKTAPDAKTARRSVFAIGTKSRPVASSPTVRIRTSTKGSS